MNSLSLGRTFSGTGIEMRHPFSAFATGFRSYLISVQPKRSAPVVVPVTRRLSPTLISCASTWHYATPILGKYFTALAAYTFFSVAFEPYESFHSPRVCPW